jgi:hypothetical protein
VTPHVPILVETLSRPFFQMVRCLYIAIEFDTPDDQWMLGLGGQQFPLLLIGLTGVVQAPLGENRFRTPLLIDGFIESVERMGGLVNFEDIWMPQDLFSSEVAVGDVYRIGVDLFRAAFAFRDSRTPRREFELLGRELHDQIDISPEETKAFRAWSSQTIERIARQEPKNPELKLQLKRER